MLGPLRVPVPEDAPHHVPTSTVVLGDDALLTSWVEGRAATRIGVLDLTTGAWTVLTGVRGMLRAAVLGTDGHALLLTDRGLTEITVGTWSTTRTLTTGIGKNNDYLRAEPADGDGDESLVAVGGSSATMETLVDLTSLTVVRRRRRTGVAGLRSTVGARRPGIARVLHEEPGMLVGATEARASAPQRLVVLSLPESVERVAVDFPDGLSSAHVVGGGILAAPPDLGRSRVLTAVALTLTTTSTSTVASLAPSAPGPLPLQDLVTAASASADAVLTRKARRTPPRTVHRDHRLAAGSELGDVRAERVTLVGCVAERAPDPAERPRVVRAHVTDLELQTSSLSGAAFEDVTVDGLRASYGSGFLFGCELRRVTLRGRVRGLVLGVELGDPDPATEERYAAAARARLDDPEWMLDLTEATGDLTIRGYPSRFVRRNPELHAVVTAEVAAAGEWRSVDPGRSALRVAILELARSGWEDVILVVDPHGAHADDDLRYVRELRARGIAAPD